MSTQWASIGKASKFYGVSISTLRRWVDGDKLQSRRTPTGQRQVYIDPFFGAPPRKAIVYVRVSSHKQKDDLERQKNFLSSKYPNHEVVSDIGSGINFKRPGFVSLLESIQEGAIGEIVVASKDRLCRFGFEIIEWLCQYHNTKLVVLEHRDFSPEEELSAELLDIVQVFCCRRNGHRRYSNKISKDEVKADPNPKEDNQSMESS